MFYGARGGNYEVKHMFHPPSPMGEPSQKLLFSAHGDIVLSSTPLLCYDLLSKYNCYLGLPEMNMGRASYKVFVGVGYWSNILHVGTSL